MSAVMILDPQKMEGLGPPLTLRIKIPPARPYAYAFLDMPPNTAAERPDSDGEARKPAIEETGHVAAVLDADNVVTDDTWPWFELKIKAQDGKLETDRAPPVVDRNLGLRQVSATPEEKVGRTQGYWDRHWRPIIQSGEYVGEAAEWAGEAAAPP